MRGAVADPFAKLLDRFGVGVELLHSHTFKAATARHDAIVEFDIRFAGMQLVDLEAGRGLLRHVDTFAVLLWGEEDVVAGVSVDGLGVGWVEIDGDGAVSFKMAPRL